MFNTSQAITAIPTYQDNVAVEIETPSVSYKTKLPTTIVAQPAYQGVKIKVIDNCYEATEQAVDTRVTPSFYLNVYLFLLSSFTADQFSEVLSTKAVSTIGFNLVATGVTLDFITGDAWKYDSHIGVVVNKRAECAK